MKIHTVSFNHFTALVQSTTHGLGSQAIDQSPSQRLGILFPVCLSVAAAGGCSRMREMCCGNFTKIHAHVYGQLVHLAQLAYVFENICYS